MRMAKRTYTYQLYGKLARLKTLGILFVFALLGVGIGLSEGNFSIASIGAGVFIGVLCIGVANNTRMAYELGNDSMELGMTFFGFMVPTLSKTISYEHIRGFERADGNNKVGRHIVTADDNEYFNLDSSFFIKIVRDGKSDIVFSAREEELEKLRDKFRG